MSEFVPFSNNESSPEEFAKSLGELANLSKLLEGLADDPDSAITDELRRSIIDRRSVQDSE